MRLLLIAVPLTLIASPALAAQPNRAPQVPRALTDPAMPDQVGRVAGALTRALLDLPVGEIAAAIEGRPVTSADRRRTVRDLAGRNDPNFDRRIEQQAARSGAALQAGAKAIAAALPDLRSRYGTGDAA
mgnify:CR=1 FL=1